MKRPISAQYGNTLEQAAGEAIVIYAREKEITQACGVHVDCTFDYHGFEVPMTHMTTAAALVDIVTQELKIRAQLYDELPVPANAVEREQCGKTGEYLDDAIVSSVQCAQRWGNHAYREGKIDVLRHVFEFNGIKVPFNPWKAGEIVRIREVVAAAIEGTGGPFIYDVQPLPIP